MNTTARILAVLLVLAPALGRAAQPDQTQPAPARVPAAFTEQGVYVRDCLQAAGRLHHVSPAILVILLNVEGGRLGAVSQNTNDTVDIGPMQVNSIWVRKIAQRWRATPEATYRALRDNLCANLEAGAWILRLGLDEARGDLWEGVAFYHSHSPEHKRTYLALVLKQALRLLADARSVQPASRPPAPVVVPVSARSPW
jgi:hypothetical protein